MCPEPTLTPRDRIVRVIGGAIMLEGLIVLAAALCGALAGVALGWRLRSALIVRPPHVAEIEALRAELRTAIGLQADKDARIATLEADLEAERTGYVRFEQERRGSQLARRQFG